MGIYLKTRPDLNVLKRLGGQEERTDWEGAMMLLEEEAWTRCLSLHTQ